MGKKSTADETEERLSSRYWNKDVKESDYSVDPNEVFDFNDFDSLARFTGTHLAVMNDRIEKQNWKLDLDISKKKFDFKTSAFTDRKHSAYGRLLSVIRQDHQEIKS